MSEGRWECVCLLAFFGEPRGQVGVAVVSGSSLIGFQDLQGKIHVITKFLHKTDDAQVPPGRCLDALFQHLEGSLDITPAAS